MKLSKLFMVLGASMALSFTSQAQISVPNGGVGPITFPAIPPVAEWSSYSVGAAAGTFTTAAALDASVIANANSTLSINVLPTSTTFPPSQNALARHNSNAGAPGTPANTAPFFLQTRATGNDYTVLMATLRNTSGQAVPNLVVQYDWNQYNPLPVNESVAGQRVYFSLTGAPGSWTLAPGLSNFDNNSTAQALQATLVLGSWPDQSLMYIIWVDDNGPGGTTDPQEGAYGLDNFVFTPQFVGDPVSVTVTAPTNTQQVVRSANLQINTTTTGIVRDVDFLLDGVLIGKDTTPAYNTNISTLGLSLGNHTVQAIAYETGGTPRPSPIITFTVIPNTAPVIVITNTFTTNIINGRINNGPYLVGSFVTVQATVTDDVGVTNVDWYVDGTLYVSRAAASFNFTYNDSRAGGHTIHGIASDAGGLTTTSASVGISVTNPSPNFVVLVPNGSTWLTYSGGVVPPLDNIGFAWYNTGYDTTGWSNLVAEIGDGDRADGYPETSVVDMGPATARHRAVWFKKEFDVINPGQFQNFRLRLLRDDGAVVHINDVPVWTNNMAFTMDSGLLIPRLDFSTNLAAIAAPDEGLVFQEFNLNPDNYPTLANGQWSIAVEVHQNSITSSDLSFDFMLWGEYATLPTLAITSPTNNTTVIAGSPFTVNIDSSTFVTNAETFINNASTGVTDDTRSVGSPSFSVTNIAPVTPGSYILTAKGRDSLPAANLATSAGVTITVIPNQPPVVNYTNVFNGANTGTVFFVGQIITNQFSVSDDQGVTNIDFLINGQLHFRTNGNFGVALVNDALAGTSTFTVRAYDGAGQTTDSSKTITVTNPPNVALLVTNGSIWKYDNSSNILDGTGWQNIVYAPEAGWASGPADIGGGSTGERNPERTIINIGVASRIPTVYFRRTFSVANPADYTGLVFNLLRDDGAVVYLNGNEVFRSNIGAAPTFLTLATAAAGDDGTTYVRSNAPNTLIAGNNVVAVEVQQSSFTSSDLTFDLMLWGSTAVVTGPTLTITLNANGSVTLSWSGGGTLIGSNDPSLPRASWTAVAGATSPHTFAAGTLAPFRFFAVRVP